MEGVVWTTKRGRVMRAVVRKRIVQVFSDRDNDGLSKKQMAKKVGVSIRTLDDHMTDVLKVEIERVRAGRVDVRDLLEVDRAMLEMAQKGHVGAARLIYARITGMGAHDEEVPTLEELEAEVAKLKQTKGLG